MELSLAYLMLLVLLTVGAFFMRSRAGGLVGLVAFAAGLYVYTHGAKL